MTARLVLFRGPEPLLRAVLDACLVRFDVLGVREGDCELELAAEFGDTEAFEQSVESTFTSFGDELAVEFLAAPRTTRTGLEDDVAIRVAEGLLVRPPWVSRPPGFPPDGVELVVPRGGAFGSGEHGSTQAALVALDAAWPSSGGVAVFCDVGTGSGILALYAAIRGAVAIHGCDLQPASVAAASALVPAGAFQLGGPEVMRAGAVRADCLVANLTADEHRACLQVVASLWSRRSPLVLSGMRVGDEEAAILGRVAEILGSGGVADPRPSARHERSGFVALTFGPYTS